MNPLNPFFLPREDDDLEGMLERAHGLYDRIHEILDDGPFHDSPRSQVTLGMCMVALEHAAGLQALMALALPTAAVSLMRHQFEALTRSKWVFYAAPDSAIDKLTAPLTIESERAAKNLPGAKDMIDALCSSVSRPNGVPASAYQMLAHFKDVTWPAMNSFVHGGLHPLRRTTEGFPLGLATQILRNSNGLATMTGMMLSVLTGDQIKANVMSRIQWDFADCLPQLVEPIR